MHKKGPHHLLIHRSSQTFYILYKLLGCMVISLTNIKNKTWQNYSISSNRMRFASNSKVLQIIEHHSKRNLLLMFQILYNRHTKILGEIFTEMFLHSRGIDRKNSKLTKSVPFILLCVYLKLMASSLGYVR